MSAAGTVDRVDAEPEEAQRLATEARDRVRFEEDALALADQVYRVARHLAGSREDAEELVQETYARAFRSWRSFQPGTNLRAWLLRILTNLNIDRGRRQQRAPQMQPLEANDYFLYDRLAESGDGFSDEDRVVERLSQDDIVEALSSRAARLPRRRRARRHRRLQLRGRRADPRHPGRHGDVQAPSRPAYPEAGARRVGRWRRLEHDELHRSMRALRGDDAAVP